MIGAVFALCTSLLGALFPLPRVLYAMSSDRLLYQALKRVNDRTKTPLNATLLSGFSAALMALIFDLHQLIDMMSIGTLLAYTIVAISVLILRFQVDNSEPSELTPKNMILLQHIINWNSSRRPTQLSSRISKSAMKLYCIFSILICFITSIEFNEYSRLYIILLIIIILVISLVVITRQPQSESNLYFKVPFVPFIPAFSILVNLYLMFQLDISTWIRFGIWLIIGYIIYFTYGIHNSNECVKRKSDLCINSIAYIVE